MTALYGRQRESSRVGGGGEGGVPRDLVTANVREGNEADEKDLEQHSSHG